MVRSDVTQSVTKEHFDAVLFDLDGVLTDTAKIHAVCWKKMFDAFLQEYSASRGESFVPFTMSDDYGQYVDGKLRYDGVRDFLLSRGIRLSEGDPDISPNSKTVCGLGNRKNQMINEILETEGVETYPDSVVWVRLLRDQGIKTAVVSASRNCKTVLHAAGIADLFDVRVDGNVAAELGLAGKPAPDTYLKAAERLSVEPKRAVVVEDAISGVQAGRNGDFGLVIGVARKGDEEELKKNGADLVVTTLGKLLQ